MNRACAPIIAWCMLSLLWLTCLPKAAGQSAISVQPYTTNWLGYDGSWSAFVVKVGTPAQWVYLMPSTSTSQTWLIGASGCDNTIQCQIARGDTFLANKSSTFVSEGGYSLGVDANLGTSAAGYFGLDSLQLTDNVTASGQVIAIINDTQIWMGSLGLGIQGTTFTEGDNKSLLDALASGNDSSIPSRSYGYTTGASYELKEVPGSLTLGGYDAARFEPNDASFILDSNQQPTIFLKSITAVGWQDQDQQLMSQADQGAFTIDSSNPFLWLPEHAADQFAETFNLTYNDTLQLYLYPNQSAPSSEYLAQVNDLTFNFTVSDVSSSNELVLSISGKAFTSASLSYGFPGLDSNASSQPIPYWPVRKAANSTQYTIGRMFLQEVYLTVDYDRNNFSLSQALFSQDALTDTHLISILSPSATSQSTATSTALSKGAVIGIAIGIIFFFIIVIFTSLILLIRRRRRAYAPSNQPPNIWSLLTHRSPNHRGGRFSELPTPPHQPPAEIASTEVKELYSSITHAKELHSHVVSAEVPDSPSKLTSVVLGVGHDPSTPVELPLRTSADLTRDVEMAPPTYAASSPAVSHGSFAHSPGFGSPGGSDPVSPLNSPFVLDGEKGGRPPWRTAATDVSSESGCGTNESEALSVGRMHHLHPASARNTPPASPRYVLDETESVHVDLRHTVPSRGSGSGSGAGGGSRASTTLLPETPATAQSRRFSWESEG